MLVPVIVVKGSTPRFFLTRAYINLNKILFLEEDDEILHKFISLPDAFPAELDRRVSFTRVCLVEGNTTHYLSVVGDPQQIISKK